MNEYTKHLDAEGSDALAKVNNAVNFMQNMLKTQPLIAQTLPNLNTRMEAVSKQDASYLTHEYFNNDWKPVYFSEIAENMNAAKMTFACSATYLEHIPVINLSDEQRSFMNAIADKTFKEGIRDYMVNQQFRRDYWVKGACTLSQTERFDKFLQEKIMLITAEKDISFSITGAHGSANLAEEIYRPLIQALQGCKSYSVEEVFDKVQDKLTLPMLLEALIILAGSGHVWSVQEEQEIAAAKIKTDKLNKNICNKARYSGNIGFLASPVTGGGVAVNRYEELFIVAYQQGAQSVQAMAKYAWSFLEKEGVHFIQEGQTVDSNEGNIALLEDHAATFIKERIPVLQALQIM